MSKFNLRILSRRLGWLFIAALATQSAAQECQWRPVGARSHQAGQPWCDSGEYLTALDLDGATNFSEHDSPIVGQAFCCRGAFWSSTVPWSPVDRAGINSHQPGPPWCPNGSYLVAVDLDGRKDYAGHDAPVVGQARCMYPASDDGRWSSCEWKPVGNSHQPYGSWCSPGSYLVSWDLDGPRGLSAYDSPVVGQAQCCRP